MLSVIVPIYNIENYLRQCIESIISQTYDELEIILVDDGSTDSCGEICDSYAIEDERIKVIHRENGGLVSARKAGLKIAKGQYVTYVDGDDWVDCNAFKNMIERIIKDSVDIVFYGHYENTGEFQKELFHNFSEGIYDKDSLVEKVYPNMIASDKFFDWQVFPSMWDFIIKKELLEKAQYDVDDDISLGEDAACIYPCLLMAESVSFVHESYYHYRQTPNSMIKQKTEDERRKLAKLYHTVDKKLIELSEIFDVRKQWISYVLFLMIPRADHLYKGYDELDFLFPYFDVKKGMRIAIYGAGTYGQRLYRYIQETGYCDVIAWFDRNYEQFVEMGLDVSSPLRILEYDFDAIIIANMFFEDRIKIIDSIKGIVDCKICCIDEDIIFSKQYLSGFGLV